MTHDEKCRYAERRELEAEITRLKKTVDYYRGAIIKCGASMLMHRLSDHYEDWPSRMTEKNMQVVRDHNEYLRLTAIQLRAVCDDAAEAALREG